MTRQEIDAINLKICKLNGLTYAMQTVSDSITGNMTPEGEKACQSLFTLLEANEAVLSETSSFLRSIDFQKQESWKIQGGDSE